MERDTCDNCGEEFDENELNEENLCDDCAQNAAEAAYDRQQAADLESPPKTLQEQAMEAYKIKKGLR